MKTISYPSLYLIALLFAIRTAAQVPVHNSYPGAQAVVFLDFDGHTVTGTSWNWNGPIHCGPSGVSPAGITEIVHRISEDYRPFAINVTTDSVRFLNAPVNKRMRIIFTSSHEWYGNAGGVSMIGSFSWGDDTPAFVFTSLLNYNPQRIGEAGAHEAGHTLGLYHQVVYDANCVQVAEYNPGVGSGEIGWAPIMGVGYYRNMTVWHNGPNFQGCNISQDELTMITSLNGISFRNDDYSSDFRHATDLRLNGQPVTKEGIIEKAVDVDLFKFTLRTDANFNLEVFPFNLGFNNAGSNLDLQVKLYDKRKTLLGTYNPEAFLHAGIDTSLRAGTYYVSIEGTGNVYTPDYASIGAYSLIASTGSAARTMEWAAINAEPEVGKPKLVSTMIAGELLVESPSTFRYLVTDMQGQVFARGNVTPGRNRISLPFLTSGLYIVRFENAQKSYAEKFMKQ